MSATEPVATEPGSSGTDTDSGVAIEQPTKLAGLMRSATCENACADEEEKGFRET